MKQTLAVLGAALLMGLVAGCNNSNNVTGPSGAAGVTTDRGAVIANASSDPFVQDESQTFTDLTYEPEDYSTGSFKVDTAVIPVRFGRFITRVDTTVTVTMPYLGDSTMALVNISKEIFGNFVILAKFHTTDTAFTLVQKPFHDHSSRNLLLKKKSGFISLLDRWVVVATSLVDGGTVPPNNNIRLTRVSFILPTGDSVSVTRPDTTYLRYAWTNMFHGGDKDVPEVRGGDAITLRATVVSSDSTGDVVVLRFGSDNFNRRRAHLDLVAETNNGDGTWTRVYETPTMPTARLYMHFRAGFFHLGVDAVTRSTIYDNVAPYSASWWGVPYRVF